MNPLLVSNTTQPFDVNNVIRTGVVPANNINSQFVYAVGTVQPTFVSLSVEKEFIQCLPSAAVQQLQSSNQAIGTLSMSSLKPYFYDVLNNPANFHIAREIQWKFVNTDNNPLFNIIPSSNARLQELIDATQLDSNNNLPQQVLIGRFKQQDLVMLTRLQPVSEAKLVSQLMAKNGAMEQSKLTPIVEFVLNLQANDGHSVKSRAINYALYFSPDIYIKTYELLYGTSSSGANPSGYQLLGINSRQQEYHGGHQVDLIFNYAGINTGAPQSWYCSVDVSGEFPYLLKAFSRFLPSK